MLKEVLEHLACAPGQVVVDATVGSGGHAAAILERISPGGWLIALDRDPEAIERARQRLAHLGRVTLINENFARLEAVLDQLGVEVVDGVLFDCGVSMEQLTAPHRGFSFRLDGPLDMRMTPADPTTAADLVNRLPEKELATILWEYGGERRARVIAKAIAAARQQQRITTTAQLAAIITAAIPPRARPRRLHAATKSFMAIRIAVNDEIGALHAALIAAIHRTRTGGRIVAITYHSGEGGETKGAFRLAKAGRLCPPFPSGPSAPGVPARGPKGELPRVKILTKKAVKPTRAEVISNPRARSATLRSVERL